MLEDLTLKVLELYEEMDRESRHFSKLSHLACPPACGKCCQNPEISASVLEMLPMAMEIITSGQYDEIYSRLEKRDICVLFQGKSETNKGQCSHYHYRPTICRLFGWMQTFDKNHEPRYSFCKIIKEENPTSTQFYENEKHLIESAPNLIAWTEKMKSLAPEWGESRPINQALKIALEKLLLLKNLDEKNQLLEN